MMVWGRDRQWYHHHDCPGWDVVVVVVVVVVVGWHPEKRDQ